MKSNHKKFGILGLISGVFIGVLGSTLLKPEFKDIIAYKLRKFASNTLYFLNRFTILEDIPKPANVAKKKSKEVVSNAKTKAFKVLNDIDKITK